LGKLIATYSQLQAVGPWHVLQVNERMTEEVIKGYSHLGVPLEELQK